MENQPTQTLNQNNLATQDQALGASEAQKPKRRFHIPKFLVLLIALFLLLGLMEGGYFLYKNSVNMQTTESPLGSPKPTAQAANPDPTADWKIFSGKDFTTKYPGNWVVIDKKFISEKNFISGEQDTTKTYNTIEFQAYPTQIHEGYTNKQWFEKIFNLEKPLTDQRSIRTKLLTGTTSSGDAFVIFSNEPSSTFIGSGGKQVQAYVLKDQTIYQLTLNQYDQTGLNIFKKILPTFKFTDSTSDSSTQNYLNIPEFGVKIPLTDNNKDAYYVIKSSNGFTSAELKVHSLDSEKYCNDEGGSGLANLTKVSKNNLRERDKAIIESGKATLVGDYYYFIEGSQAICTQKASNQTIEVNARKDFINILKNITAL